MKKWICLLLVLMMGAGCVYGLAEGVESEKSSFLQIRENVTAKVFANPGDTAAVDTLESGKICGLLEEIEAAGKSWFCIFYLDSKKQGQVGYISTDDAVELTEAELSALMEDRGKMNEILDLINALDAYLEAEKTEEKTNGSRSYQSGSDLKQFYTSAMNIMKNAYDRLKEQSVDMLKEKLESAKVNEKVDELREKLESFKLSEKLDELKGMIDETDLNEKLDAAKELMESIDMGDFMTDLEKVDVNAVMDQIEKTSGKINSMMHENSNFRNSINSVIDELKNLFK